MSDHRFSDILSGRFREKRTFSGWLAQKPSGTTALHPEADIRAVKSFRAANDPKPTFISRSVSDRYNPELTPSG
jgi:hypothetical protein